MVFVVNCDGRIEPNRWILGAAQDERVAQDQVHEPESREAPGGRRNIQDMAWNFADGEPVYDRGPGHTSVPSGRAGGGAQVSRRGETPQLTKPFCRQS